MQSVTTDPISWNNVSSNAWDIAWVHMFRIKYTAVAGRRTENFVLVAD